MASIVLTGGGTAGHIMPNLALLPELFKKFDKITYMGGAGMEKELVPKYGIPFCETKVVKLDRSNLLENLKIPFVLHGAVREAKSALRAVDADLVFSKGGYAALPACLAARALKIPVVVHESDYTMGVANKLISRFAAKTLTSFPETPYGEYVGNPIRKELFEGDAERARNKYRLSNRPAILVFGGSLGSEAINRAVYAAAPELTRTHTVVHITGKNPLPLRLSGYRQIDYADDIGDLYALAELVVIRGGANSLAEAAALGKRAVTVPLPKGASRGDQLDNAESYQKRGYAIVLRQENLTPESLINTVRAALKLPPPPPLKNSANEKIAEELGKVLREKLTGKEFG